MIRVARNAGSRSVGGVPLTGVTRTVPRASRAGVAGGGSGAAVLVVSGSLFASGSVESEHPAASTTARTVASRVTFIRPENDTPCSQTVRTCK